MKLPIKSLSWLVTVCNRSDRRRRTETNLDRGQVLPDPGSRIRTLAQLLEEFDANASKIASQYDRGPTASRSG